MVRVAYRLVDFKNITPQLNDGKIFLYKFEIIPYEKMGQPDEKANIKQYNITVEIVRTRISTWQFKDMEKDLEKILYWFAHKKIEEILSQCPEMTEATIKLHSGNTPKECPYDPTDIEFPPKKPFLLDVSRRIGF